MRTLAAVAADAALPPLRGALQSGDPELAAPAARALGLRRDREAVPELARLLTADSPPIQLAAAEALARCADMRALPALWEALRGQPDRFLEHALVHAVHRTADGAALGAALQDPNPRVQKAALLLLDQPPRVPGLLGHQAVISRVAASDPELRQTALSILQRHPEWSEHAAGLLRGWLQKNQLTADERTSLPALLLAFQGSRPVQDLIAESLASTSVTPAERRVLVLETLARVSLAELPLNWAAALGDSLGGPEPAVRRQAVHTAAVLQMPKLDDSLIGLAARAGEPADLRSEALRAAILRRPRLSAPLFGLLLGRLDRGQGPLDRLSAAEVLGHSHLDDAQTARLIKAIRGDTLVSPAVLLPALQRSVTRETASAMLDYLAEALRQGWRPGEADLDKTLAATSSRCTRGSGSGPKSVARRRPAAAGAARAARPAADWGRSGADETSSTARRPTATCHRADSGGGQIGPDLTRIGAGRAGRDLLESILFPSSTIAQGFDNYAVVTKEGQVVNGVISRQTADTLILRDSSGAEIRLRRDAVDELARTAISLMPERLAEALTPGELRDLMAYLQSLK